MKATYKVCVPLLLLLVFAANCNGQDHQKQTYAHSPDAHAAVHPKLVKTQGTGPYDNVHCGLQDKDGNLWFGTTGEGVYRYNGKTFTNFTVKNGLSSNIVYSIIEDKEGFIWLGTKAGLCRYNSLTADFTAIQIAASGKADPFSFVDNTATAQPEIWNMLQDKTGKVWLCTTTGVYCCEASGAKVFTHFLHNDGVVNKSGIRLNAVSSIIEDRLGNIWFATWFEGLCRYDGKTITGFKPNGEVWFGAVFEDRNGNIWAGRRDKGVCRLDPSAAHSTGAAAFTNVLAHGVFDSCSVGPIAEDKEGNIWFATEFGELTHRETKGGVWRYDPRAAVGAGSRPFVNLTTKEGLSNMAVFSITKDKSGKLWFGTRGMGLCSYDPLATLKTGVKVFVDYTE